MVGMQTSIRTAFEAAQDKAANAQERAMTSGLYTDWARYEHLRAICHKLGDIFFSTEGSATIREIEV